MRPQLAVERVPSERMSIRRVAATTSPVLHATCSASSRACAGEGALALELLLDDLVAQLLYLDGGWFSTHDYQSELGSIPISALPRWMSFAVGSRLGVVNPAAWDYQSSSLSRVFGMPLAKLPFHENPRAAYRLLALRTFHAAQAIVDVLGRQETAAFVAELRNRFAGQTFTYLDFESVLDGDPVLRPMIREWLMGMAIPAFRTSRVEMFPLVHRDDRPEFQGRVHVLNDGSTYGVVRVIWGTPRNGSDFLNWHVGDPAIISPLSAAELGFVSREQPADVWLLTYLSRNRQDLRLRVQHIDRAEGENEHVLIGYRPSGWRPDDSEGIIVDDLDEGFSVEGSKEEGLLAKAVDRLLPRTTVTDHGLRASPMTVGIDSLSRRRDLDVWSRMEFAAAWGKYRRTMVHVNAGSGGWAVFKAGLPRAGCWRLEYHLPDLTPSPRFSTAFRGLRPVGVWTGGRQETYGLVLSTGTWHRMIEFDATAGSGWHEVGTFDLRPGDYELLVSAETSGDSVIADAIRWTPVEYESSFDGSC